MPLPNDLTQANLYDGIANTNEYSLMPGVCILPLAEDPPIDVQSLSTYSPVVIAQLHAPYRIRKYTFSESKQNNPPVVQTPKDVGAFKFIGGELSFFTNMNSTWWNADWNVSGNYTYVENCVSRPQDGFVLGSPLPFSTDPSIAAVGYYLGNQVGNPSITVGAIAQAGNVAAAGYVYGQYIGGLPVQSQDTDGSLGNVPPSGIVPLTLGIVPAWNYTMTAFYPGTLFNDELANGSI